MKKYIIPIFVSLVFLMMASCTGFDGDQTIPAYIHIDKITVKNNPQISIPQDSGFLHNDISVVGITISGKDIGVFTLPCTIPILKEGKHDLVITPGVKLNGMAGTRLPDYLFLKAIQFGQFNFVPDSIITIDPSQLTTTYNASAKYPLFEEFESKSSFDSVMKISKDNTIVKWGRECGFLSCPSGTNWVESKSNNIYDMSNVSQSAYLYVEFDYRANTPLYIGLLDSDNGNGVPVYVVRTKETDTWTKMYITIGRIWIQMLFPTHIQIVFGATNPDGVSDPKAYIDNVKFLYI